jgi:hypothetical protein
MAEADWSEPPVSTTASRPHSTAREGRPTLLDFVPAFVPETAAESAQFAAI